MANKYPLPTSTQRLILDPTASGTIVQYALAIEVLLNLAFGIYLGLYPAQSLSYLVLDPKTITPLSTSLAQMLATLTVALNIPMLFSVPSTRRGIEMRAPIYWYLGGTEVFLIVLLAYFAFFKSEMETGLRKEALMSTIGNLVPPLVFRGFVLYIKPVWLGRYVDGGKSE